MALKTPDQVLMLSEKSLNFLDLERPPPTPQNEESCSWKPKKSALWVENAVSQNGQLARNDSMYGISNTDATVRGTSEDMTVVDAASLRWQIIKINRHLQLLEEETRECAKRELAMYSITVAF